MKTSIYLLLVTASCILTLFGGQSLVGEWNTSFGRYSETLTFRADGTFQSIMEVVRGPKQDSSTKSIGKWELNGQELLLTTDKETTKEKISFSTPNSFETPSDLGQNGVLKYERNMKASDPGISKEDPKKAAGVATSNIIVTEAKPGSAERKSIMDTMRGPVSKYARKEVIFTGDVRIAGDWAKFTGHVGAKDGKPFAKEVVDELEMDFLAILKKVNGKWTMEYHGWSGDIGTVVEARAKLPGVPESLLPKISN